MLLMILLCREQENLAGNVSGDTSLIIGQSKMANWLCFIDVCGRRREQK